MKSITGLLTLSVQLALHIGDAHSLPVRNANQDTSNDIAPASISRAYPVVKREDGPLDPRWEKRGGGTQQMEKTPASHDHLPTPSSSKGDVVKGEVIETAEKNGKAAANNDQRGITRAQYHAKAAAINAKHAGKELFHGPVRGLTEAPLSSVVGAVKHAGVACRYAAACQLGNSLGHVAGFAGKPVMGVIDGIYLTTAGIVHAVPPGFRAAGHSAAMIGHGVKQGYQRVIQGKESERKEERPLKLNQARQRTTKIKKDANRETQMLRSSYWDSSPDGKEKWRDDRNYGCCAGGSGGGGGGGGSAGCGASSSGSGNTSCFLCGCA